MGVNFGRLGTVILNKGAQLVCTSDLQITSPGGGGGGDVTPNPTPNWTTIDYNGITGEYSYSSQQIQGINTTITLKLNYNDTTLGQVYYNVNSTEIFPNSSFPPPSQIDSTFTKILDNETLTVSNNEWICFGFDSYNNFDGTELVNVRNVSDNNNLLDSFNIANVNIV